MDEEKKRKTSIVRVLIIVVVTVLVLWALCYMGASFLLRDMFEGWDILEAINDS